MGFFTILLLGPTGNEENVASGQDLQPLGSSSTDQALVERHELYRSTYLLLEMDTASELNRVTRTKAPANEQLLAEPGDHGRELDDGEGLEIAAQGGENAVSVCDRKSPFPAPPRYGR